MRIGVLSLASLGALAISFATAACASGPSDDGASVPADQFVAQLGAALCDSLAPCCANARIGYDAAACKANLTFVYAYELGTSRYRYDPVAGARCVQAAKDAAASCYATDDALRTACDPAVLGAVAPGEACSIPPDCAVPAGGGSADCKSGICVANPPGALGDACDGTCTRADGAANCSGWISADPTAPAVAAAKCWTDDGLFCGDGRTCEPLVPIGRPCAGARCVDGAYCGSDGTCAARVELGGACRTGQACVRGAYCATTGTGGICTPFEAGGAPCTSNLQCMSGLCDAGACRVAVDPSFCGGAPVSSTSSGHAGASG